jgi:hypothetical protein
VARQRKQRVAAMWRHGGESKNMVAGGEENVVMWHQAGRRGGENRGLKNLSAKSK